MRWFVSLLLLLTGAVSAAAPQTQTFTDDLGRTVTVPLHPQRIVSMHDLDITIPLIELGVPPVASHGRTRPDGSHYLRSSAQLTGIDFDNSDINTIKVLEIEPAGFYRYDADNIDDLSIIRRWFGISDEKNSDGSAFKVDEDIKINIEHCSMNALIGKNVDLATEYDLIIVGAYGKDRMNMGILKNVYSKENSKIQEQGYSNAVKENGETALELNGNDISEKMYNELY